MDIWFFIFDRYWLLGLIVGTLLGLIFWYIVFLNVFSGVWGVICSDCGGLVGMGGLIVGGFYIGFGLFGFLYLFDFCLFVCFVVFIFRVNFLCFGDKEKRFGGYFE